MLGDGPPERTEEMKRNGQVWVWLWDTPREPPKVGESWFLRDTVDDEPGRWEVRGTGCIIEPCEEVCNRALRLHVKTCAYYVPPLGGDEGCRR